MNFYRNKGVTLISLMIAIVVIIIIAGISIYSGGNLLRQANLEKLKTNMLLIQARAKGYAEEVNFKMGKEGDQEKKKNAQLEIYETKGKLKKASEEPNLNVPIDSGIDVNKCYLVTREALQVMGLETIETGEDGEYLIQFDEDNITAEIYNTNGYMGKYSLTEIDKIQE